MAINQEQLEPGEALSQEKAKAPEPKHAPIDPAEEEESITQEAEHSWKTGGA